MTIGDSGAGGTHPAVMATVTIPSRALADHHGLAVELLARAKNLRLAGATVLPGPDRTTLELVVVDDRAGIEDWLASCHDLIAAHIGRAGPATAETVEDVEEFRA